MEKKPRVVVALGGNALQSKNGEATAEEQLEVVKKTCDYLADIIRNGYEIVIVHGNGPQVGRILLASETAKDVTPAMPFDVCGAMSQGYIGYHIQQALNEKLMETGLNIPVVTILTQVEVDPKDPAFQNPSKPIGPFYSREEAAALTAEKNYVMKEDAGRGFRRVVPSPKPVEIVELATIKELVKNTVVITCGGGGIPVIRKEDDSLEGVAAVIDKDFAAELVAEKLKADVLLILTEVEHVAINFHKPDQKEISRMTVSEAEQYIREDQFAAGSMLPKVQAGIRFASAGGKTIITSLFKAEDALKGETGTVIVRDQEE